MRVLEKETHFLLQRVQKYVIYMYSEFDLNPLNSSEVLKFQMTPSCYNGMRQKNVLCTEGVCNGSFYGMIEENTMVVLEFMWYVEMVVSIDL